MAVEKVVYKQMSTVITHFDTCVVELFGSLFHSFDAEK